MSAAEIARGRVAPFEVPPFCSGMAQNCAHYTGGCDQCLVARTILEGQDHE